MFLKRFYIATMLVVFIFNAIGYVALYEYQNFQNEQNVAAILRGVYRKPDLVKFELSQSEFNQLSIHSESKEFIFHGNVYDIVSSKIVNGKHLMTCYNDTKEKSLKNQYKNLVRENGNSDKSSKGLLLKKVLGDYYCQFQVIPNEKITISAVNDAHKALFYQLVSIETGFPSKEIPPPKQTV